MTPVKMNQEFNTKFDISETVSYTHLTEFEEEYKLLPDFTENPPSWLYSVLERTVMRNEEKHRKSPTIKFTITYSIRYTSPASRNRYANHQTYSTEDVEGFVNQSYALEKERETKEYQLSLIHI